MPWFLIRAKPQRERYCCEWVERAGAEPYLPMETVQIAKAFQIETRERPFFPSYLFAREGDVDPVSLRYLPGVVDLLRRGDGKFARLSDEVIDQVRTREESSWSDPVGVYRPGEDVTVQLGPFCDVVGKFIRMDHVDRASVLIEMFRCTREIEVGLRQLSRLMA